MLGILVSFWEGLFSGAMLVSFGEGTCKIPRSTLSGAVSGIRRIPKMCQDIRIIRLLFFSFQVSISSLEVPAFTVRRTFLSGKSYTEK